MTAEHCYNDTSKPAYTALIYCRVSSRKQLSEGSGLDSQEHRCRQHATQKGYDIENVFLESVSGGLDIEERPALQALLHYLDAMKKTGKSYVVIFDDHKRFARHTEMHLRLKKEMAKRNAKIEYLNVTVDETPEGEFIETMLAAQAQLERQQNARQVRQKTKARLEKGFWTFRAPVGYKYVKSKHGGKELVKDEPLASIIKEALEGFACGRFASQTEVKRFFEADPHFPKDLPNGELRAQTVVRICEQVIYAGYLQAPSFDVSLRKGVHEPLVSLQTFEKIQERRKDNGYLPARKDISQDFPLRGAVCCHDCKKPLRGAWTKGMTKYYAYYVCQTKSCPSYAKSIARDKIESAFADMLQEIQPSKTVCALITEMFKDAWETQTAKTTETLAAAKREAKKVEKEIDTLISRIMDANNPRVIAAYEDRIAELEKKKLVLSEQSVKTAPKKRSFQKNLELSLLMLANPHKLWALGSFEVKRIVLKLVIQGKMFYDRNPDARTPLKALPHGAFLPFSGGVLQDGAPYGTKFEHVI